MKKQIIFVLTIVVLFLVVPAKGTAISFDLSMLYEQKGMSDQTSAVTPSWVIINTSSQPLIIGSAGLPPFATMDFGSLPIQSPKFIFKPNVISGYTLNPGESIGSIHGQSFLDHPLPTPTYDLTHNILFEFAGDYIPGSGTGRLNFGFGSAYVDVPIAFEVKSKPFGISDAYITGTFSSIPEPATLLLLGLGGLALRLRSGQALRRKHRAK